MKINESQLRKIIRESLNEIDWTITSTLDDFNTNEKSDLGFELYSQDDAPKGAFCPAWCYAHGRLEKDLRTDLICFEPSSKKEISSDGIYAKEGTYKCNYQGKPCTLYAGISVNLPTFVTGLVCYDDDKNAIEYIKNTYNLGNLNESQLRKIIKESVKKVMKEAAFYPNYPENTIENTIWNQYNLPWNKVDDSPERYNGVWFISVDYFDYTAHLGKARAYGKFKSLEECLEYAQNFSFEAAYDLYCEQLSIDEDDEGFTSISLNIMCKCEDGIYEVANTKLYKPN